MTVAMAYVALYTAIPVVITLLLFVGRKELWRAIVLLSIISLIAEIINVTLWVLQTVRAVPIAPIDTVAPVEGIRFFASGFAKYLGATAWVICILVAAQQRRIVWACALTIVGAISIVSLYAVDHPLSFFPQSAYGRGDEVLIIFLAHVITILTLTFGLLSRPKRTMVPPQAAFYAPPAPLAP